MQAIHVRFMFDVGDFVQTAWDAKTVPKDKKQYRGIWQVIERTYTENCSGHQIQYVCRSQDAFANKQQLVAFVACEIVDAEVSE